MRYGPAPTARNRGLVQAIGGDALLELEQRGIRPLMLVRTDDVVQAQVIQRPARSRRPSISRC